MSATEEFFSRPPEEQKRLKAAITLGRQPKDNVYVLGDVQDLEQQKMALAYYCWVSKNFCLKPYKVSRSTTDGTGLLQ